MSAVRSSPELVALGKDGRGEDRVTSCDMIDTEQRLERAADRSEEHTSELQSLMSNSYAVFCLKKNTQTKEQERYLNTSHDYNTAQNTKNNNMHTTHHCES